MSSYTQGSSASWQYEFWPTGERYAKTNLGTSASELYIPRGGDVATEYTRAGGGSPAFSNRYAQGTGIDQKYVRMSADSSLRRHYLGDQVGTVSVTLADDGAVAETSLKDAWGVQIAGAMSERYGYAHREHDPESGLVHMRARMYDPRVGRFTQSDAFLANKYTKPYVYSSNNPITRIDPIGLQDVTVDGWEMYGMNDEQMKKHLVKKLGAKAYGKMALLGELSASIKFSPLSDNDPDRDAKLKWLAHYIEEGFKRFGHTDAAKHFAHWKSGKGNTDAPTIPLEKIKNSKSYQRFLEKARDAAKGAVSNPKPYVGNDNNEDTNLYFTMGEYLYHYTVGPVDDKGNFKLKVRIDDKYDFHVGKDATIKHSGSLSVAPMLDIMVNGEINVPDALLVQIKPAVGAKDYDRTVEWEEVHSIKGGGNGISGENTVAEKDNRWKAAGDSPVGP